jgi:hypothetical protein
MSDLVQVATEEFFVRTLQWMQDDQTTIVLTPQVPLNCFFYSYLLTPLHESSVKACTQPAKARLLYMRTLLIATECLLLNDDY